MVTSAVEKNKAGKETEIQERGEIFNKLIRKYLLGIS